MSTRTKSLIVGPAGLVLLSAGLWIFSEAAGAKYAGTPFRQWFLWGLYGLILINGGLLLFGLAVRYRAQLDYRRFVRRELKKRDQAVNRLLRKQKAPPVKGGAK